MTVLTTERLSLRQVCAADAEFIRELLNEPAFLQNIGDRGVRSPEDAARYIEDRMCASYREHGFGLYLVERKADVVAVGICGFVRRDFLEDVDIGFAFLERYWSQGYAFEAASAVMEYGRTALGLRRILAITAAENPASIRLLGKLGLHFEGMIVVPGTPAPSRLFQLEA